MDIFNDARYWQRWLLVSIGGSLIAAAFGAAWYVGCGIAGMAFAVAYTWGEQAR